MKSEGRRMRLTQMGLILLLATAGFADTVTMKSGRTVSGTYLGGTARTIRVDLGDRIETLDVTDVVRIDFGATQALEPSNVRRDTPVRREENDRPVLRRNEGNSGI